MKSGRNHGKDKSGHLDVESPSRGRMRESGHTTSEGMMKFPWSRRQLYGFDQKFYSEKYPDVAASGVHPISHFLNIGWKEGRDPSKHFSTLGYLRANPDVAKAGLNPLLHFLEHGLAEGRTGIEAPFSPEPYRDDAESEEIFLQFERLSAELDPRSVCEIGTLQAVAGCSTHLHRRFPNVSREDYLMVDIQDGPDVDFVADLHSLPSDWTCRFDCVIASAVFEHLKRPWIAAKEVSRVLRASGLCFIFTHQTFPLHGYPEDYFRFSKEALRLIFEDAGLDVIRSSYLNRCMIIPPHEIIPPQQAIEWNISFPSYLNVGLLARKAC